MDRNTPQSQDSLRLDADPTADVECHLVDDRFVPARAAELVERLIDDACERGAARAACDDFARALTAVVEQESAALKRGLLDDYSHFNPDRDTLPLDSDLTWRTPGGYAELDVQLAYLLDKANFERLDEIQLEQAVQVASTHGMVVRLDPQRVERLTIFVRGRGRVKFFRKSWRNPIRGKPVELDVFRRLVFVARLADDPHVLIKMFKDIPACDVEALLPHADVTMSWTDRLLMIGGGAGAAGSTAMKVLSVGLAALSRTLWLLIVGLAMLTWRTFSGYRSARQRRDSQRTRHLYYQNVANNGAAIDAIVSMIEQEELKEAVAAYLVLLNASPPPATERDLDQRVERWVHEQFKVRINFDCGDALETLDRFSLWIDRGNLRVAPVEEAARRLREHWLAHKSERYHFEQIEQRKHGPPTPAHEQVERAVL